MRNKLRETLLTFMDEADQLSAHIDDQLRGVLDRGVRVSIADTGVSGMVEPDTPVSDEPRARQARLLSAQSMVLVMCREDARLGAEAVAGGADVALEPPGPSSGTVHRWAQSRAYHRAHDDPADGPCGHSRR